jgi:phage repressor protein C with HTH and peptisase S24 domain
MCKILKVSGYSLSPHYQDGDYVLVAPPFLSGAIRPGNVLAFRQPGYDIMIKRVESVLPGNRLFVVGNNDRSVDSREFGPISRQAVIGRVILHIKR